MQSDTVEIIVGESDLLRGVRQIVGQANSSLNISAFPWGNEHWVQALRDGLHRRAVRRRQSSGSVDTPLDLKVLLQQPGLSLTSLLQGPGNDIRLTMRESSRLGASSRIEVPILIADNQSAIVSGFDQRSLHESGMSADEHPSVHAGYATHGACARKLEIDFSKHWNASAAGPGAEGNMPLPLRMRAHIGTGIDDAKRRIDMLVVSRSPSPDRLRPRPYGDFVDAFC